MSRKGVIQPGGNDLEGALDAPDARLSLTGFLPDFGLTHLSRVNKVVRAHVLDAGGFQARRWLSQHSKLAPSIQHVIVQTFKMSGDRNTIGAALTLLADHGALILIDRSVDSLMRGRELFFFYESILGRNAQGKVALAVVNNVDGQYQTFKAASHRKGAQQIIRQLPWIKSCVDDPKEVMFHWASVGTKLVGQLFSQGGNKEELPAQQYLRKAWSADDDLIADFLISKGIRIGGGKKYVLMWVKQGGHKAAKAHHFTSLLTWRVLAERIARETGYVPVAIGEEIGFRTSPSLVQFWNDPAWQPLQKFGRRAQLALFGFLATRCEVLSVGMISGALEAPAMLGIPTLYIEEESSDRLDRFASWQESVPGFEHMTVEITPGFWQQQYWKGYRAQQKAPLSQGELEHMQRLSHFGPSRIPGERMDVQEARGAFLAEIRAARYTGRRMLFSEAEMDRVVDWVRSGGQKTPRAAAPAAEPSKLKPSAEEIRRRREEKEKKREVEPPRKEPAPNKAPGGEITGNQRLLLLLFRDRSTTLIPLKGPYTDEDTQRQFGLSKEDFDAAWRPLSRRQLVKATEDGLQLLPKGEALLGKLS